MPEGQDLMLGALFVPVNLIAEVGSAYNGMLTDATSWFAADRVFLLVPGMVLADTGSGFLLLADGLRRGWAEGRSQRLSCRSRRSPRNRLATR